MELLQCIIDTGASLQWWSIAVAASYLILMESEKEKGIEILHLFISNNNGHV